MKVSVVDGDEREESGVAEVIVFHHVQGLTAGIRAFGDVLADAGHTVHSPDLFEGQTFDTLEDGLAHARSIGFDTVLNHGIAAADSLGSNLVYVGFSMGVMAAQQLAQTRSGAKGAVFVHACLPVSEFGEKWPEGVPVQIHGMDADPFFAGEGDLDAARELAASAGDADVFTYPGDAHLFADSSLPTYDAEATALMMARISAFLDAIG